MRFPRKTDAWHGIRLTAAFIRKPGKNHQDASGGQFADIGEAGGSSPIMAFNEVWNELPEEGYLLFCSVAAGYSMNAVLYKM